MENKIVVFESKKIRRIWHNEEWFFSVVDVCGALTDTHDDLTARKYWNKLSQRLRDEGSEVVTNCHRLKRGVAGTARKETEKELGRSIVSSKNYLSPGERKHLSHDSHA